MAANTTAIVTNQADIDEARPMAKGTKFTYGGYIQLDAIASSYSDGRPNDLISRGNLGKERFIHGSCIGDGKNRVWFHLT